MIFDNYIVRATQVLYKELGNSYPCHDFVLLQFVASLVLVDVWSQSSYIRSHVITITYLMYHHAICSSTNQYPNNRVFACIYKLVSTDLDDISAYTRCAHSVMLTFAKRARFFMSFKASFFPLVK